MAAAAAASSSSSPAVSNKSAGAGGSSSVPSLPPPRPKSPPQYPDLYGKRRETAKVQMLEREISFLEDELKSIEGLQPASIFCKEVADFVVANSDPFIPANRKNGRSCRFWKWLCGIPCFNLSWICCCCSSKFCPRLQLPRSCCCFCSECSNCCGDYNICSCPSCNVCSCTKCKCKCKCKCNVCDCCSCATCPAPKCHWCCCFFPCSKPKSNCCRKVSADSSSRNKCCCCCGTNFKLPACPRPHCSSCCTWKCSFPKCPKVHNFYSNCCTQTCCKCNPCCLFF